MQKQDEIKHILNSFFYYIYVQYYSNNIITTDQHLLKNIQM
jgi:hypothetical protein